MGATAQIITPSFLAGGSTSGFIRQTRKGWVKPKRITPATTKSKPELGQPLFHLFKQPCMPKNILKTRILHIFSVPLQAHRTASRGMNFISKYLHSQAFPVTGLSCTSAFSHLLCCTPPLWIWSALPKIGGKQVTSSLKHWSIYHSCFWQQRRGGTASQREEHRIRGWK